MSCNVQGAMRNVRGARRNVGVGPVRGNAHLALAFARARVRAGARCTLHVARCTICFFALSVLLSAQGPGAPPQAPKSPRDSARVDLTGYWVSIVTEDWRFRMVTAPKGDYPNVPVNAEGKKVADAWDPAKDEA